MYFFGVSKKYDRHTTFETGVADATPATPLPAPLSVDIGIYLENNVSFSYNNIYVLPLTTDLNKFFAVIQFTS